MFASPIPAFGRSRQLGIFMSAKVRSIRLAAGFCTAFVLSGTGYSQYAYSAGEILGLEAWQRGFNFRPGGGINLEKRLDAHQLHWKVAELPRSRALSSGPPPILHHAYLLGSQQRRLL